MAAGEEILFQGTLRDIYIVYGLPETASFFVFCSLGQRCGKKPAGIIIFLVSLQYFKGFIYRASKFHTPHKRWLGSLKYVYLDKFYKQFIPRTFRVLNPFRRICCNYRFHPVGKPTSDTTKPTQEIYLYKHSLSELSSEIDWENIQIFIFYIIKFIVVY